jgi:acetolactate synthase-1/2/3 large subunit
MTRTGAQLLAEQLRREGVEVIFGLPGNQLMYLLDGLYGQPSIRFVTTRHEQATTFMADGYARAAGRPGVALVVPGPGVYNAGAGLSTAWACSSPVLLLAGQIERYGIGQDMGLLHEVHEQLDIVRPVTKLARRVTEAGEMAIALREAFAVMTAGRQRPVHLEFPPEALSDLTDAESVDALAPAALEADPAQIARAAALLAAAENPVIIGGGGAVLSGASATLVEIAEFLQAAVVNTREGKGVIDERNPLFVGTAWTHRRVQPSIDEGDVILAVGTRFQGIGVAPHQKLIRIDADHAQLTKYAKPELGIRADAALALIALRDELDRISAPRASRGGERQAAKARVDAQLAAIGPQGAIVDALRRGIPENALNVIGTTTVGYMCHLSFPVYEPRSYFSSSYMGTLGYCFPTALGVKVARPDRPVVSINGDGGFLYCATELATAKQFGINVVTVVCNDGAYGNTNRDQRENFGGREYGTLLENPDFALLAESFGAVGVKAKDLDALEGALREGCEDPRPVVIEYQMERLPNPFI